MVLEVNFDCSEKGMQVQSMDSSHVALASGPSSESFPKHESDPVPSNCPKLDSNHPQLDSNYPQLDSNHPQLH